MPPPGLPPIGESGRSGSRMPPLLSEFLGLGGSKTPPHPGRTFARATDDRTLFKWVRRYVMNLGCHVHAYMQLSFH